MKAQNSVFVSRNSEQPLEERLHLAAAITDSVLLDSGTAREIVGALRDGEGSNKVIAREVGRLQEEMKALRAGKREAEEWAHERVTELRRKAGLCLLIGWLGFATAIVSIVAF